MNKPTKALAVLIIEDLESDAQLLVRLLKKADYDLVYEQVETAEQMRAALEKRTWDIVISDYKMPQFDGRAALKVLQEVGADVPFIVVSGTIGEETAVSMMKAGAHDYLIKGNLARLVPAVERELEQAEIRRERRQAEKALSASEAELRALFASMQDVALVIDREGVYRKIAPTNPSLLFRPSAEMLGRNLRDVFSADQAEAFIGSIKHVLDTKQTTQIEYKLLIEGRIVWFETSISPMDEDSTLWVARDVSARKQAEEALAASEAKLRALVEQVPTIVYTESVDTRETLYISPQVEKLTGYTSAEWIAERSLWQEMIYPEDLGRVLAEDERSTITHEPFYIEYRILTRDGRTFWIHDEAVMIQNQDGTPLFWQGVIYDITERKQAEEAMLTTNILLERALEQSPVPMVLVSMPDGIIRSANSACRRFLGVDNEPSPVGTPLSELKMSWQDFDMQGNPATVEDLPLPRSLRGLKTDVQEHRIVRKDGTSVYGLVYGSPIFDSMGKLIAGYLVMIDITERRQAEEALLASEERFHTLYDNTTVGLYRTTPDGRILMLNPAGVRMLGFDSFDEIAKRNLNDAAFEADYSRKEFREKLESKGVIIGLESKWLKKDGSIIFVRESAKVFRNEKGEVLYYDGSFEDITERKRVEEQLRKLSRAVEQNPTSIVITDLLGNIEYVNPKFSQITGYGFDEVLGQNPRILKSGYTTREEYQKMWDTILSGNIWQGELLNRKKNGETYWESATILPVFSEDGKITNFLALKENITERKQAEKSLREREEQYRTLVEQIPGFVFLDDASVQGRTLYVSPQIENILGFTPQEWQENSPGLWSKQVHPDDLERAHVGYMRCFLYGEAFSAEYRISASDGRLRWVHDQAKMLYDENGRPRLILGVTQDVTERKQAEEGVHQRVTELEMLYQSGLALSQLLNPKEIGQKILELLEEKLDWHHTRIRLYHPQDDSLELLDFNRPGLKGEIERSEEVERFQSLITNSSQGMNGWVVQHGLPVRSGDVSNDPRYVEAYPGIRSGLYVPMKLGERIVGVISVESEQPDAFSEADERLIVTLANQAASAFENARLFGETHQRVMELETLNRISLVLRAVSKQVEMLSIVLDEALAILNTSHGSIELYNKTTNNLEKTITRGWITQVTDLSQKSNEGIAGKVFTSGEIYISREFASDLESRATVRSQMPPGWGGVCMPIRTTQQTLGVLLVSIPSERELNSDEIRLLSILSEMTGAALQRMQLHEQTVRRLEQLNALRAVDQAISSNLDMRLTLNILLDHTVSQLDVDAADVLLLAPGSSLLDLVAHRGFSSHLLTSTSLSDSFAKRAIMEHHSISALDFEIATQNPHFGKLWKEEGFVCYWCVPLIVKGEVKGVLEVYCRKAFTPDAEWLEFLESLAGQAAITIDTSQLFENLQRANLDLSLAYDATIEGWSRAMDLRDHETEGHTLRVTGLTMKLARTMGISESQLTAIRRGALLHDIGKIGVPDAILLKEGKLTDEEWAMMRQHPQLAHDMLAPIAYLHDAIDIPYCHHEKWDGTGYPQGLKGDRIPLIARIFAIIDVWDALTNDRTYRKKWTKQKARQYIKDQSGKHFDPQVVDVFLKQIGKS